MTSRQALAFVKVNGIVLESARGPAPSLAGSIAGKPIRGSWWGHTRGPQIFRCSRVIRASEDVLVCRLVEGKVTYVHRRLWPALVKLHAQFEPKRIAAIREVHTAQGKHKTILKPFPDWVPRDVMMEAATLTSKRAAEMLPSQLGTKRQH
jgi:hypothetical protein